MADGTRSKVAENRGIEERFSIIHDEWQREIDGVRSDMQRLPVMETQIGALEGKIDRQYGTMDTKVELIMKRLDQLARREEYGSSSSGGARQKQGETRENIAPSFQRTVVTTNEDNREEGRGFRRLELPTFNGFDPDGWVYRAERYFQINRMSEEEKMEAIALSMEGKALAWYQWIEDVKPLRTWGDFKANFLTRFRSKHEGSLMEKFLAIKQETTVEEYQERYEILASPLKGLTLRSWKVHT